MQLGQARISSPASLRVVITLPFARGRAFGNARDQVMLRLIEEMEVIFQHELEKLSTISRLSPELGEAARGRLETGKADCLAQVEEVFADYRGGRASLR